MEKLTKQQKAFVMDTIDYFFGIPKDEIKIRMLILEYLDSFTDEELITYTERLNEMRPYSNQIWWEHMKRDGLIIFPEERD